MNEEDDFDDVQFGYDDEQFSSDKEDEEFVAETPPRGYDFRGHRELQDNEESQHLKIDRGSVEMGSSRGVKFRSFMGKSARQIISHTLNRTWHEVTESERARLWEYLLQYYVLYESDYKYVMRHSDWSKIVRQCASEDGVKFLNAQRERGLKNVLL
ncbi:hypothetical protein ACFE04_005484 [Oxalis oulophora]